MLRRTGGTEGFYRQAAQGWSGAPQSPPSSNSGSASERAATHGGGTAASAVQPETMDDRSSGGHTTRTGHHHSFFVPPGELGRPTTTTSQTTDPIRVGQGVDDENDDERATASPSHGSGVAADEAAPSPPPPPPPPNSSPLPDRRVRDDRTLPSDGRTPPTHPLLARRQILAARAAQRAQGRPWVVPLGPLEDTAAPTPSGAATQTIRDISTLTDIYDDRPAVAAIASTTVDGMEYVWVATTSCITIVCARTHFIVQILPIPHIQSIAAVPPPTSLSSSAFASHARTTTGGRTAPPPPPLWSAAVVTIAHDPAPNGATDLSVWVPVRQDPASSVHRHLWECAAPPLDMRPVFYDDDDDVDASHHDTGATAADLVHPTTASGIPQFSLSVARSRVLVAHKSQAAVVDLVTAHAGPLWTTAFPAPIHAASLSGDGEALAVALRPREPASTTPRSAKTSILTSTQSDQANSHFQSYESNMDDDDDVGGWGVYTFERDWDDGADVDADVVNAALSDATSDNSRRSVRSSASHATGASSPGLVYKPSPFLVQNAPVSQLAFRGLGRETSNATALLAVRSGRHDLGGHSTGADGQGCDLLLVVAGETATIYNQNSWRPLVEWTLSSPQTRVDFVRGWCAFTVADLDGARKKKGKTRTTAASGTSSPASSSRPTSRRPSLDVADALGGRHGGHHYQSIPSHTTPLSNAGAWVSEASLERDGRVSLRLSRLTYLRRGIDDLSPTLFENISGSLQPHVLSRHLFPLTTADGVPSFDPCNFCVQGVWPAWNPRVVSDAPSSAGAADVTETLRGSAMAALGLSSTGPGPSPSTALGGMVGDPILAGTQTPPCHVQIVASHSFGVSVCDFVVLGDSDWTSLELSNPTRSLWRVDSGEASTSTAESQAAESTAQSSTSPTRRSPRSVTASLSLESSRLEAHVVPSAHTPQHSTIQLTWQRQGSMHLLPTTWVEDVDPATTARLLKENTRWFKDESVLPVPCALPSYCIDDEVAAMEWWPDTYFEEAPLLLVATRTGALRVLEVPPPWTWQEPCTLRNAAWSWSDSQEGDPSVASEARFGGGSSPAPGPSRDPVVTDPSQQTYDVLITPHPEYGLGLRLEVMKDGQPAVAGSFKRHPLTGELLPAEKTGMVVLGDEIVSANGVTLEGKLFDEIIGTVRDLGSACTGTPMRIRFRKTSDSSTVLPRRTMNSPGRRTAEEIIGIRTKSASDESTSDPIRRGSASLGKHDKQFSGVDVKSDEVGSLPNAYPTQTSTLKQSLLLRVVSVASTASVRSVLAFACTGGSIFPVLMKQQLEHGGVDLGVLNAWESGIPDEFQFLEILESEASTFQLVLCDHSGKVGVLGARIVDESKISYNFDELFQLERPDVLCFRASSIDLMAAMSRCTSGKATELTVWSANPQSGVLLSNAASMDYSCAVIRSDEYLSFEFVQTGFLASSPAIVAFGRLQATMFSRQEDSSEWIACITLLYNPNYPSIDPSIDSCCARPHVVPTMLLACSSRAERTLLSSDWHPDSILAQLFTDDEGVDRARLRMHEMLHWLANQGNDLPESFLESALVVAPLPLVDMTATAPHAQQEEGSWTADAKGKDRFLPSLMEQISKRIKDLDRKASNGSCVPLEESSAEGHLPTLLNTMCCEDLLVLRACCEFLHNPPSIRSLDVCGQHFVAAATLFRYLGSSDAGDEKENISTPAKMTAPTVLVKSTSYIPDMAANSHTAVASTGCLAALLSRYQGSLISICKALDEKIDWPLARQLRIPFWIRSDVALAKLCEEIGQTIFREKKDIMEAALFFVIARKVRTLRNLAAADQSDNGRKLFKFLTAHDFSSDRGRVAAEKNAFSLLRKCQYRVAAAFFLLSEPPALNSAIETVLTKLRDIDLAFLVARLVESKAMASTGAVPTFGGVLGGGGGYAAAGSTIDSPVADDLTFNDWVPDLGGATKRLLINRTLPISTDDNAFCAVQLLWLGKAEEACWCLPGFLKPSSAAGEAISLSKLVAEQVSGTSRSHSLVGSSKLVAREKSRVLIDFVSAPKLLKYLRASERAQMASSLLVAQALTLKGIEISCMNVLLRSASPHAKEKSETENMNPIIAKTVLVDHPGAGKQKHTESSIFDAFDVPIPKQNPSGPKISDAGAMESSIFASFDVGQLKQQSVPSSSVSSGKMESYIFDSFGVPPVKSKAQATSPQTIPSSSANSGNMESSIFDAFGAPPLKSKAKSTSSSVSANMESSIFDSYDTFSQKPKPVATTTGPMESSIFDTFDMRPRSSDVKHHSQASLSETASPMNGTNVSTQGGSQASLIATQAADAAIPSLGLSIERLPMPDRWLYWRTCLLLHAAARRLLREIASILAPFHGDPSDPSISTFYSCDDPLVPSGASGIVQLLCDFSGIQGKIQQSLEQLSVMIAADKESILRTALALLGPAHQQHRIAFGILLHLASSRADLAEHELRSASFDLIQHCYGFAYTNDNLQHRRRTKAHVSSQFLRRKAARVSWQLEICLWLHRGNGMPLTSFAFKEAVVAVRVGLLVASWNHNFECLEVMIRSDPDCPMDDDCGRHLWTSLKLLASNSVAALAETKRATSGGWEFLVDCRRSEATQILREKRTGTFIIRPHSGDNGVFTLSFKTNLVPSEVTNGLDGEDRAGDSGLSGDELSDSDGITRQPKQRSKPVRKDDVVQHAIIRLSEAGYRCGSFGPYTTLISLLEAVSDSLPFNLRFDLPPTQGVIKEEGTQPSPNAVFLRKLALSHADSLVSNPPEPGSPTRFHLLPSNASRYKSTHDAGQSERLSCFGTFVELLGMSAIRRQLSSVATAEYDITADDSDSCEMEEIDCLSSASGSENGITFGLLPPLPQDRLALAFRMLGPLSKWCRSLEVMAAHELSPSFQSLRDAIDGAPVDLAESAEAIEAAPQSGVCSIDGGDALLRKMIQRDSGVEFSTLRLVDGGDCTIVVIFSQVDTIRWLVTNGVEDSESSALSRLQRMKDRRVIEAVDLSKIKLKQKEAGTLKKGVRYRILDPWEVEALHSWEGETLGASLGRERFLGFNLGKVGLASEGVLRSLGGLPLLALWTCTKGGVVLTKALASVQPPWERASGGDLQFYNGVVTEQPPFINSIRQHLYRNALFRRLDMPQRFLALVQVELLDLKNLTAPGGSLSMSVYALLRLKRDGTTAALTNKARTLDTATTQPVKLGKSTGPNAPASWGSVVRFRFPLPEQASVDGVSFDRDRELLFKGPPTVLQVSVYEKKLLVDNALGTADIRTDGLWAGGQLEEWVPLRSEKHGISWFARVRLTLRFELMCLATKDESKDLAVAAPSVGLRKVHELSQAGGAAHEDLRRSVSSPDLITYFESMVY